MNATVTALGPVLVGVDGSTHNASAVAWAAAEASASHEVATLVLVHDTAASGIPAGRAILERAALDASEVDHRLEPAVELVTGGAADSLRATASTWERALGLQGGSALLVVGRRGQGASRRINLGRTARTLVQQDGPPLVVVPDGWSAHEAAADAPVVVDVGSGGERDVAVEDALSFALGRARREGRRVLALACWSVPANAVTLELAIREVWSEHAERAERALERVLAPWRSAYPDVVMMGVPTDRSPVLALLDHADGADLLVVPRGTRASAVVEYARCPVAVL